MKYLRACYSFLVLSPHTHCNGTTQNIRTFYYDYAVFPMMFFFLDRVSTDFLVGNITPDYG